MSVPDKSNDTEAFKFGESVRYFFDSIKKLMCALPPLTTPYGFLWYLGLPLQLVLIILGKLIRFPAEIWESSKNEKVECENYNKLGFIGDILTFVIDSIMYLQGGILKIIDIVIMSLGFGREVYEARDLVIRQVEDLTLI